MNVDTLATIVLLAYTPVAAGLAAVSIKLFAVRKSRASADAV
jgi:hypothetical protein